MLDFSILSANWLEPAERIKLCSDEVIDLDDLSAFINVWTKNTP